MASGQRTGKQTAVLVISVISIIGAVLTLLLGVGAIAGGGFLMSENGAGQSIPIDINGQTQELDSQGVGALAGIAGIVLILSGVFNLLMGIFGIRGANDASKIGPFFVMAIISTVFAVLGLFGAFDMSRIVSVVISAVCIWLGYSIKKEAAL